MADYNSAYTGAQIDEAVGAVVGGALAKKSEVPQFETITLPKGRVRGDVDGDGAWSANDKDLVLKISVHSYTPTEIEQWCADINGDGTIGSDDGLIILNFTEGTFDVTPTDYYGNWIFITDEKLWKTEIELTNRAGNLQDIVLNVQGYAGWGKCVRAEQDSATGKVVVYAKMPPIEDTPCILVYSGEGSGTCTINQTQEQESEIFIAIYDTTTYGEISAALSAGKYLVCKLGTDYFAPFSAIGSRSRFQFGPTYDGYQFTCSLSSVWSTSKWTGKELPTVTSSDNGKLLEVVNGAWTKSTGVSDATASALGLTGDPTVDDALGRLAKKSEYKVGDIKVTARTDLGDEWLLCNGDTLQEGYADLSNIMVPIALSSAPTSSTFALGTGAYKFVELDGTPYVLANNGSTSAILYTLSGTQATSIWASGYSAYTPKGAAYGAGYYVIPGSDTHNKQFIGYKSGLTGTATLKEFSDGRVGDITYQNGYFVMVGETSSSYPCIWYATTPGGTWTQVVISSEYTTYSTDTNAIHYLNGRLVAVWGSENGVVLAHSADGIAWSKAVKISGNYYGNSSLDRVDIAYARSKYCIMQTSVSNQAITVFTSLNLDSGWGVSKVTTRYAYYGIIANFLDNIVLICQDSGGYYGAVYLLNADGSWTTMFTGNGLGNGYAFAQRAYTDTARMCVGGNSYLTNWYINVPKITFDGAYAYIKAKEATT